MTHPPKDTRSELKARIEELLKAQITRETHKGAHARVVQMTDALHALTLAWGAEQKRLGQKKPKTRRIYLRGTRDKELKRYATVDAKDFDEVNRYSWHGQEHGHTVYALATGRRKPMHRLIMGFPKKKLVDHINGNGLDNRRENLRIATFLQNSRNRHRLGPRNKSGRMGVAWKTEMKAWCVRIKYRGKDVHVGYFKSKRKAFNARTAAEKKYWGNFPY